MRTGNDWIALVKVVDAVCPGASVRARVPDGFGDLEIQVTGHRCGQCVGESHVFSHIDLIHYGPTFVADIVVDMASRVDAVLRQAQDKYHA